MNDAWEQFRLSLRKHHPEAFSEQIQVLAPVTDLLFARLTSAEVAEIECYMSEKLQLSLPRFNDPLRKAILLRIATHCLPKLNDRTKLHNAVPHASLHRMQKKAPYWCGDFYSANMLIQTIEEGGEGIYDGRNYLDFGCSTGSLVRVMHAAYPAAGWFGVDPVRSSVAWAQDNLQPITFACSAQWPPLDYSDGYFSGISAISVWSHFSERAALAWFSEMHRLLSAGSWLMFTTHGFVTLDHYSRRKARRIERLRIIRDKLEKQDIAFESILQRSDLNMSDWGNCYMTRRWVSRNLSKSWNIRIFQNGRNQSNQDVYLLIKI